MRTEFTNPVSYFLPVGSREVPLNELIGKEISLHFSGKINCISCGKKTKKSFSQGFCYPCFKSAPEADESAIRPELSKAHLGIARDMEWARNHDLVEHYVYLALSGGLKVGVTRHHQIPVRWIDQGASCAIKVAKSPNRHIAGVIEVWFKRYFADKTNWQAMLKNQVTEQVDLRKEKEKAINLLPVELRQYMIDDNDITCINYPVMQFPVKIRSLSFDNNPKIKNVLAGIKGQYLLFDNGEVLNIRKHNGYCIELSAGASQ